MIRSVLIKWNKKSKKMLLDRTTQTMKQQMKLPSRRLQPTESVL